MRIPIYHFAQQQQALQSRLSEHFCHSLLAPSITTAAPHASQSAPPVDQMFLSTTSLPSVADFGEAHHLGNWAATNGLYAG